MQKLNYRNLLENLLPTVREAGEVIMAFFEKPIDIATKPDSSPVTEADQSAETIILRDLKKHFPDIPVVAEEAMSQEKHPKISDTYFLVDPLDGTREFVNQRDEFTVNIGLIENNFPTFGIILAPALGSMFATLGPEIAGKIEDVYSKSISVFEDFRQIRSEPVQMNALKVLASRSHLDQETQDFLKKFSILSTEHVGSSLKFCSLAQGDADLYPRFGPTMEWDTAAGQAILQAAGGTVERIDGLPFEYGKFDAAFKNPGFIAWGKK